MYSLSHSFKRIMSEVRFLSVRSLSKAPMQQANTSLVHCLINFCLYTPYSYSWGVIARNRLILAMLLILDVLRGINVNDMAILSFAYNCYHKSKKKKEKKKGKPVCLLALILAPKHSVSRTTPRSYNRGRRP